MDIENKKVAYLHRESVGTFAEVMGIEITLLTEEMVIGQMRVERKLLQPFGLLHGGASVSLAETLASLGAWFGLSDPASHAVGIEINANHIRSVKEGIVVGTAIPLHRGRTTHVWEIKIVEEASAKLVCISRCTLAIVPASKSTA